jgi:lipopolysaccharide transport system permease protein
MLDALWRYRSFIESMVRREFQARYTGSALGVSWSVLQPLAMIFIYTVVFGQVMRNRLPGTDDSASYGFFLCAGLLPWTMFTETLQRCTSVFVEQGNLLKKTTFPRAALPIIVGTSALVNFAIIFALLLVVMAVFGRLPGFEILALVPLLLIQQAIAIGFGVALGVFNVFFRDIGHAVGILLQFWFWFTPIVYPLSILGPTARSLIALNPMTNIVDGYQGLLVFGRAPDPLGLLPQVLLAVAALVVGRAVFRRLAGEMADFL